MSDFTRPDRMGSATNDSGKKGWLVSILELGAWFGVLCTGYLADKLSRKYTIFLGQCARMQCPLLLLIDSQLYVSSVSVLSSRARPSTPHLSSAVRIHRAMWSQVDTI